MTGHVVHGMRNELVVPDWPPLTGEEVRTALGRPDAELVWHSPRPMSAAGLVVAGGARIIVKRHDKRVRSWSALAAEHAFARWLRAAGQPVPDVLPLAGGESVWRSGDWRYEAWAAAGGADLYRDAMSWSPFQTTSHAHAAGAALARLHLAAEGFPAATRPFGPLISSSAVIAAADPEGELERLVASRPGLAAGLAGRPWRADLSRWVWPAVARASEVLRELPAQWGHGDWHPSNLTWTSSGQVVGIFDFGLANRTSAVHDLAVALERSVFSWLDMPSVLVDRDAERELLRGYESVRVLSPLEREALGLVLPVAHVEYALSELEYFADVVGSAADAALAYEYLVGHTQWLTCSGYQAVLR